MRTVRCAIKECGKFMLDRHNFFSVRKDYYRLSDNDHERLWHVYFICRECAEKEWAKHDNPSGAVQESLFG